MIFKRMLGGGGGGFKKKNDIMLMYLQQFIQTRFSEGELDVINHVNELM